MSNEQDILNRDAEIETLKEKLATANALVLLGIRTQLSGHRTRTAALTIMNTITVMRQRLAEEGSIKDLGTYLDRIDRVASSMRAVLVSQPHAEDQKSIDVNAFLSEGSELLQYANEFKSVEVRLLLDLPAGTAVKASGVLLQYCLDILVQNSAEAMRSSAVKVLTVSSRLAGDSLVEIGIGDTGCGIPENIRSRLLRAPAVADTQKQGLGVGLLIARMIIQSFAGDIRLAESGAKGTTFVISLPKVDAQQEGVG